jgi:DNA polymerase elongation subunit (family B)
VGQYSNHLIYGRDETERIVCVESRGDTVSIFKEHEHGIEIEEYNNWFWLLTPYQFNNPNARKLDGNLHYRWIHQFEDEKEFKEFRQNLYKLRKDMYCCYDPKEAVLITEGMTYYKGMNLNEISVLAFDIETNSLQHKNDSLVITISNTFRKNGKLIKKLFSYDEYETDKDMLDAWCQWVMEVNPSIICGHNIFSFDLPYLQHCAKANGTKLLLGRDGSEIEFNKKVSQFRKDGSQSYDYTNAHIFGREIIDTMFLSYKYDLKREFESYGLKQIIKQLGLEKKDRVFYDAAKIRDTYQIPEEMEKIKQYCFAPESAIISLPYGQSKYIEELTINDTVVSSSGKICRINKTFKHKYNGDMYDLILENGRSINNVTKEHPFLVTNGTSKKWVNVEDLKIRDCLVYKQQENISNKNLYNFEDDLWWLFGLYMADGYIRTQNQIKHLVLYQHSDQSSPIIKCLKRLNLKYYKYKDKRGKINHFCILNQSIADLFEMLTGGKFRAWDKQISKKTYETFYHNKNSYMNFLAGYIDGDGSTRLNSKKGFQCMITTTSKSLYTLVDTLCHKHGMNCKLERRKKTQKHYHNIFRIYLLGWNFKQINSYLKIKFIRKLENVKYYEENVTDIFRIKKIIKKHYTGIVYNIEVEKDNTYLVNNICTHNCKDDSDDSLGLFDFMAPIFFYQAASVPKSFQQIINGASGSQLNSMTIRAYLQDGHSIPEPSEVERFEGAISFGIPGIYKNCFKIDFAALYPSIIRQYRIYDKQKDPKAYLLQFADIFTEMRLHYKQLAKETNKPFYKDMEQTMKAFINSLYGYLGAPGLHFNSPDNAALVTKTARELISKAIEWATNKPAQYWIEKGNGYKNE